MKPVLERLSTHHIVLGRCDVCRNNGLFTDAMFVARNYSGQESPRLICRDHAVMLRGENAVKAAEEVKSE